MFKGPCGQDGIPDAHITGSMMGVGSNTGAPIRSPAERNEGKYPGSVSCGAFTYQVRSVDDQRFDVQPGQQTGFDAGWHPGRYRGAPFPLAPAPTGAGGLPHVAEGRAGPLINVRHWAAARALDGRIIPSLNTTKLGKSITQRRERLTRALPAADGRYYRLCWDCGAGWRT